MKGGIGRAAAAVSVMAIAVVAFASPAFGLTIPIPNPITPPIPIKVPTVNCKPPPPVRDSATGVSATFDGSPVNPYGPSIYDQYGVHPFSWAVYDPGCAGDVSQPAATLDTFIGDELLGVATDLVAFSDGIHNLITNPTWLGAFDRFETNATNILKTHVFDVFLPLSLVIIGLLVVSRSHKGNLALALKMAGWGILVMALVTVVASEPVRIGHLADQIETTGVNSVDSALAGSQSSGPDAAGTLEVQYVLYPAWLRGEVGSDTSATALTYGPQLLDGQAYKWAELNNGVPLNGNASAKNSEFQSAADKVQKTDPGAYRQLTGQAGGRIGAGVLALVGALTTVPFRVAADLLVVASLLLLRLEVVLLPVIAVIAIHHRFRHILIKGVLTVTGAALLNALVFSAAAAVNVLIVGFILNPSNGIPTWFGLILAGILAVVLFYLLKPFRRLTHMVNASEVTHAVSHAVTDITHQVGQAVTKGATLAAAAATGGSSAAATAGAVSAREAVGDHDHDTDVEPWVNQPQQTPPEPTPPEPDPQPVPEAQPVPTDEEPGDFDIEQSPAEPEPEEATA